MYFASAPEVAASVRGASSAFGIRRNPGTSRYGRAIDEISRLASQQLQGGEDSAPATDLGQGRSFFAIFVYKIAGRKK